MMDHKTTTMLVSFPLFSALRSAEARMARSLEAVKASPCDLHVSNLADAVERFRTLSTLARTAAEASRQGRNS